ncbi:hypothetical protein BCR35DRAFT_305524 [Leucosporidium creatinivorum]|uniref:Uncharacterized protein n=1 Tax=Leucosporidium creatinivorum TaxID=106004 RepID=A0A1Y2F2N9_9BASI|nr:hypothetical protein BCR35DRAFT_305524 [Leucosporidium creatinivorum]
MVPEKRPSSPDPFAAPTSLSNGDSDAPPAKSRRLNSLATAGPRKAIEMNRVWVNYIENVMEEEDFSEALLAMESMIGRLHIPIRAHIRQLVALSLSPPACLRTVKNSDVRPSTSKIQAPSVDPLPATERKIRHFALRLLGSIASTLSGDAIFCAIKGHGVDETLVPPTPALLDKRGNPIVEDEDDEEAVEDQDTPLMIAGKRMMEYEDVWALLGAGAAKGGKVVRTEEQPMAPGAWELLRTFVGVWEGEAKKREDAGELAVSPSLMQSLKANSTGVREVSSKLLDIIIWPFKYHTSLVLSDSEEDEDAEEEDGSKGTPIDSDELSIADKQAVAMRLLALLSQAMATGRLDASSLLHETTLKMKGLSSDTFASFLERLPLTVPFFTIRLITYYLETHSLASLTPPTGSPTASPSRRRTLGPNGSASSLHAHPNGTAPEKLPLPSSHDVLSLLSKLPSDFPLPPSAASDPLSVDLPARRAPSSKPRSFTRVSQSCEAHSLLKQALLEALWVALEGEGREREKERMEEVLNLEGEAERVLKQVEGRVEEARTRIEGPKALIID